MKKKLLLWFILLWVILPGCAAGEDAMGQALDLRSRLLCSDGYTFDARISADFGDRVYTFSMNCQADSGGNLAFTVTAPESIAGITGKIDAQGGKLTFDDTALAFELLADGRFSPVSGPCVLVHTLHFGYITACARTEAGVMVSVNDSYADDALNLSVYLGADGLPTDAEIFWRGSRVLSLTVSNFSFL